MIDIHHHLLPALDDGARNMDMSLAMVEMAIADGITHIACTPHASHSYFFDPEHNATLFAELQDAVTKRFGEQITLGLGCDFHLMFDNIEDAQRHPTRYTINGHNYLLVEFPDSSISPNTPADLLSAFALRHDADHHASGAQPHPVSPAGADG